MDAATPQVEWGWRIQCAHPDCEAYLSEFRATEAEPNHYYRGAGPPPLPYTGRYDKVSSKQEWFFRNKANTPYLAYCPEHSVEALDWMDRMALWRERRREFGKKTHTGLLDRLKEWGARLLNIKVGQTVQDWTLANPPPEPPWKEAV